MKIELKYLAPYLPYVLKVINIEMYENGFRTKHCIKNLVLSPYNLEIGLKDIDGVKEKPILYPISDFGDKDNLREVHEFIGLGNWCEAYDNYFDAWFNDACSIRKLVLQAPQEVFNYFIANHFDVFGLIDEGLAISMHDVEQIIK